MTAYVNYPACWKFITAQPASLDPFPLQEILGALGVPLQVLFPGELHFLLWQRSVSREFPSVEASSAILKAALSSSLMGVFLGVSAESGDSGEERGRTNAFSFWTGVYLKFSQRDFLKHVWVGSTSKRR